MIELIAEILRNEIQMYGTIRPDRVDAVAEQIKNRLMGQEPPQELNRAELLDRLIGESALIRYEVERQFFMR